MSKISDRVDGIAFDMYRARFTGTIDLEDTEAEASATSETLVMVTIATVDGFQAKLDKEGDLARIAVLKVNDARVLDPELRDLMIERLGLSYGDMGAAPTPVPIQPGELAGKYQPSVSEQVMSDGAHGQELEDEEDDEEETGEISGFSSEQLSFGTGYDGYDGVVGMVGSGQERWRSIGDG